MSMIALAARRISQEKEHFENYFWQKLWGFFIIRRQEVMMNILVGLL